jgi:hypothetical protein
MIALHGRGVGYSGSDRVEAVVVRHEGEEFQIPCGAVLVDYHAFERQPELVMTSGQAQPRRDSRGFVVVDAHMATSEAGVFAAGDVTGRYASTLMALGDGVCAGFSAYEYVFKRKFGRAPSLFAYAARQPPTEADVSNAPFPLPERATLVPLMPDKDLRAAFSSLGEKAIPAADLVREGAEVLRFRAALALDPPQANAALFEAMHHRVLTLHATSEAGTERWAKE